MLSCRRASCSGEAAAAGWRTGSARCDGQVERGHMGWHSEGEAVSLVMSRCAVGRWKTPGALSPPGRGGRYWWLRGRGKMLLRADRLTTRLLDQQAPADVGAGDAADEPALVDDGQAPDALGDHHGRGLEQLVVGPQRDRAPDDQAPDGF